MKTLILTKRQAVLILQNIPPDKSITARNGDMDKILSAKSDKPIKRNSKPTI